jgi:hypothetical protein
MKRRLAPLAVRAALGLTLLLATAAGCARWRPPLVRPHQRVHLADRIMRVDNDRLGQAADQHVLGTREGAFGGNGTAGGGCGCN